ncbi:hypothetical protein SELMODRAFT_177574 [Selaginella moellendorffii]|uniref:Large ribosomal subunit protein uL15/eL18 domain-containing protein n=3 Tax=Selaginella moellendorffii TaxID=88036 RepID=D8S7G9_SELML|nr:hypothetical protein SELMODRAFT_177574 [Selaginella moellendorffii]
MASLCGCHASIRDRSGGGLLLRSNFTQSFRFSASSSVPAQTQKRKRCIVTAKNDPFVEPPAVLDRFRLHNLAPQPGSRHKNKRKGRGHSAGQGGSCGFGMRGQKSRAGPKVRPGFEGGQMPLYRRLPKLKGIAGGMRAGVPKYVAVNIRDIATHFNDGEEVSLETLTSKRIINPSGKEKKLPLKVLGDLGDLQDSSIKKLSIKARSFSASAKVKLEAAGCTLITLPGRKKWVSASVSKNIKRAEEYFAKKKGLVTSET